MGVRILYLGEIVGKPGIFCVKSELPKLKQEFQPTLTIANADGATGGYGIGKTHAIYLRKLGVDIITGGDQIYFKKDLVAGLDQLYHVLRPANFPAGNPGRGWRTITVDGSKIAVVSLLGLSGFSRVHLSNPYTFLPEIVKRIQAETKYIVLDFHSVTTAEKAAMSLHADGQVSACIGSGMRVLSADAEVLPGGTATISDSGRSGSIQSVNGLDPAIEIRQFMSGVPERSMETWAGLELQGCVIDIGDDGKAVSITTFRRTVADKPSDSKNADELDVEEAAENAHT
jgi:2',3'-cyclic-nucleotide 2'-phosphodiesterase